MFGAVTLGVLTSVLLYEIPVLLRTGQDVVAHAAILITYAVGNLAVNVGNKEYTAIVAPLWIGV